MPTGEADGTARGQKGGAGGAQLRTSPDLATATRSEQGPFLVSRCRDLAGGVPKQTTGVSIPEA